MERYERPTIMDGKVVEFAEGFAPREGIADPSAPRSEALGPYRISASRNAVIVHKANLKGPKDVAAFIAAVQEAQTEAKSLARTGWGGDFGWRE